MFLVYLYGLRASTCDTFVFSLKSEASNNSSRRSRSSIFKAFTSGPIFDECTASLRSHFVFPLSFSLLAIQSTIIPSASTFIPIAIRHPISFYRFFCVFVLVRTELEILFSSFARVDSRHKVYGTTWNVLFCDKTALANDARALVSFSSNLVNCLVTLSTSAVSSDAIRTPLKLFHCRKSSTGSCTTAENRWDLHIKFEATLVHEFLFYSLISSSTVMYSAHVQHQPRTQSLMKSIANIRFTFNSSCACVVLPQFPEFNSPRSIRCQWSVSGTKVWIFISCPMQSTLRVSLSTEKKVAPWASQDNFDWFRKLIVSRSEFNIFSRRRERESEHIDCK